MRLLHSFLMASFLGFSIARAALPVREDVLDKSYWNTLDEKTKPVFLMGFGSGAGHYPFQTARMPSEMEAKYLSFFFEEIPKLVPAIDAFYKDRKNDDVYLRSAIEICLMQLQATGVSKEEIAAAIKNARTLRATK